MCPHASSKVLKIMESNTVLLKGQYIDSARRFSCRLSTNVSPSDRCQTESRNHALTRASTERASSSMQEEAAGDAFVPSRDLPSLRTQPSIHLIQSGLYAISLALGAVPEQSERVRLQSLNELHDKQANIQEDDAQVDPFEERLVQQWLLSVATGQWTSHAETEGQDCIAEASRLIAISSGQLAAGKRHKTYCLESGHDVDLVEAAVTEDSLGSRTWSSATILANEIASHLNAEVQESDCDVGRRFHVLELGAGTGLVGLSAAQFLHTNKPSAKVTLTDFDSNVLSNLRENAFRNRLDHKRKLPLFDVVVDKLDWRNVKQEHHTALHHEIDVIVAADCVYEAQHAKLLWQVAETLLAPLCGSSASRSRGKTNPRAGKLLLMMPFRPTHVAETQSILDTFPLAKTSDETAKEAETDQTRSALSCLCITSWQDFTGHDDFGPPPLRIKDVRRQKSGQESRYPIYLAQPRFRTYSYRRGPIHSLRNDPRQRRPLLEKDLQQQPDFDDDEGRRYRLYTIERI